METRKKGLSVSFLPFVSSFLAASPASAISFHDWSSGQKVTDPQGDITGDTAFAGRDILYANQAYDAGYLYFRIDLANALSGDFPSGLEGRCIQEQQ